MTKEKKTEETSINIDTIKIAILSCEDFTVLGGAQRLLIDVARALHAIIICPTYDPAVVKIYDPDETVQFSSLDLNLPAEPYRQLWGKNLFRRLSLDFDFIVCNDDMASRYLIHDCPHLYYFNTPRRALYDMYYIFLDSQPYMKSIVYQIVLPLVRMFDQRFVKHHVHNIACISHNTRNRIQKYYQKDARVIYPSLHLSAYYTADPKGYWLSVGRIDKWKRIELQIEAFRQMPDKKLIVAGPVYPDYVLDIKKAPSNVNFIGAVSEKKLCDLYAHCNGFITTAIDEDFGITPIEAMASGKPVVATKEGGYLETIADGLTGILIGPSIIEICSAVHYIDAHPEIWYNACIQQVQKFTYERFCNELRSAVTDAITDYAKRHHTKIQNETRDI